MVGQARCLRKNSMAKPTKKQLEDQIVELTNSLQRERADAQNLRRRSELDRREALNAGQQSTIANLLPTLDNLERAFTQVPKEIKSNNWVKGIISLDKQLKTTISKIGLTKIKTLGQPFNPEAMEAVSIDDQGGNKEVVTEELQAGYRLNGQVIRVAMVKVGKLS